MSSTIEKAARIVCPSCNGRGTDEWGATCLQCGGIGRVTEDGFFIGYDEEPLSSLRAAVEEG